MNYDLTKLLFRGVHEVCRKRIGGGVSHIGYFDNAEAALKAVENDKQYEAIWLSLNPLPKVPDGFTLSELKPSATRSKKEDYTRRTFLLIDSDPVRTNGEKKSNTTEAEKATARKQAEDIRRFLCDELQWPRPVFCDSGNGFHQRYAIDLPNDQASEDLIRNLLAGLAAKFDNELCSVDAGNFESNRVCKLYGTYARKAPHTAERPHRQSLILDVPTREIELPGSATQSRQLITEYVDEPVPLALLESTVLQLPVPHKTAVGVELSKNDAAKLDWLRSFLLRTDVAILKERVSGNRVMFDVICPWEDQHGSTTSESSTSVWYTRGYGYGFNCKHSKCTAKKRTWFEFRKKVDPEERVETELPSLPTDATNALIARYFRDQCPEFHNHVRVYDAGRLRATFVNTRWDMADQSNILLMAALQPVCDRLRWDLPEPLKKGADYRRVLEGNEFRQSTIMQLIPMLDKIRFGMFDASPYLIGMPGGTVGDLRTGITRPMERNDFITRRLQIAARDVPTPVYDYFLRSISSANGDQPDEAWIANITRLLGYCLLGACPFHIWPLWTGDGGNGKSCLARLLKYILNDFCALVRWSELTRDERGGDSTFKRLAFKLMGARVALVEEMGEASNGHRVIEISTVKQLTGGGEITGAAMRQNEITGEIKFKLLTLMNRIPHIEPDDAMKRRVQIFPFRASFDETNYPGCTRQAMERKNAPEILRAQPERIEALMREEAAGILFKWLIAARDFIADGEQMKITSDAVREATASMFREADLHGRFAEERLVFDARFDATTDELNFQGAAFQRETQIPMMWDMEKLAVVLRKRGCIYSKNLQRDGTRKRGWVGVKLLSGCAVNFSD